jgi:hypothetical protein
MANHFANAGTMLAPSPSISTEERITAAAM